MKMLKSYSLISSLLLISLSILLLQRENQSSFGTVGAFLFLILGGISLLVMLVNFSLSNLGIGKKYFVNASNFLCSSTSASFEYEQDAKEIFEKTSTILEQQAFHILKNDPLGYQITARSKFHFRTFGENLYLRVQQMENKSLLTIHSATCYGSRDYGNNSHNIRIINDTLNKELNQSGASAD